MGRPSLAPQRRTEILDAVGRCVSRYGVDGTTLENVAAESGLSRSHVRHYLGNREELINAFAERLLGRYAQSLEVAAGNASPGVRTEALMALLFGKAWGPSEDNSVIDALLGASATDEHLRAELRSSYLAIERSLTHALAADIPHAPRRDCATTAYALICMAFGHSTLSELSFPRNRGKTVRQTARAMVDDLRNTAAQVES